MGSGIAGRHRGLLDVQPTGVLVDGDGRARPIGIRELRQSPRHHIEEIRPVLRNLHAVARNEM